MENSAYPCPACGAPADLGTGCSGCGRPPYPPAAEVFRLDREIVTLGAEAERARQAYHEVTERLGTARRRRAEVAAAIRAEFPAPVRPAPAVGRPPVLPAPAILPARPGDAETSTRTVQGVLFVLGGLLLGTAAVVFTAVAWASVGIAGRALILAALTALALAVPLPLARRGLRGTAETIAAVGLLLVLLDGYAAWTVDLAGVAGWSGTRYAALVGGASAAVAVGYARLSGLTGPWFAGLLLVQPVPLLLVIEARPGADGWAAVLVGLALLDLAVLTALRRRGGTPAVVAGRVVAWGGFALALVLAAGCALVPLALGRAAGTPLLAGAPLLLVAAALFGAAVLVGPEPLRHVAAGLLVPVLGAAVVRPVAELRSSLVLLAAALVAVALAGAVRVVPVRWRTGPRTGALVVAGALAQLTALTGIGLAITAVGRSLPSWQGAAAGPATAWGWQLPVAVALSITASALLLPRSARPAVAVAGGALTAFALPAVGAAPWPAVVAVDLVAGVALLGVAVVRPAGGWLVRTAAVAGAVLIGHGLLVGLADPVGEGVVLAVVLVAGLTVAAVGRRGSAPQRTVAGTALAAALLAVPAGAAVATFAVAAPPWWQVRAALAAVVLLALGLWAVRRHWPDLTGYASTALALALPVVGVVPVAVPADEPVVLYAAVTVLVAVLGDLAVGRAAPLRVSGTVLLVVALAAAVPVTVSALVTPYGHLPAPWSGAPSPVSAPGAWPVGLALVLVALAATVAARAVGLRAVAAAGASGALAVPVLLVAAGAPWPLVPAAALLMGVAAVLLAAFAAPRPPLGPVASTVGLVLAASGLLGASATRAGTLAALGVALVAATAAGTAGRSAGVRLAGCLVAVTAATGFALAAARAAGLPPRTAAFGVLAVAALTMAVAALAATRLGPRTAVALDGAAQAVALVALLLTTGSPRHAATVCVLWGAAVALRVLRPGEPVERRWAFVGIAGGSELLGAWLLLVVGGVTLVEAYTLPAAALALAAGLVALRTRPGLTSWPALGPGLAAALLPSLALVLGSPDPQPWRRLLLGVAAVATVLAGATRRWQAPVVLGTVTLTPLALHELARSWDLLPRWIFLALGGLALIGLAATYERRRRDLARLRTAIGRMD
ncbi:SCO7613 C-terminal domain-containing membrane protein [Micromonospora sp. NPDC049497]|uniref:SCO7613 C-terminal domain-containing membrane protein n=1 Tax=Micromonospora sp. NPDC049497 TaxID=3364273 RepID=UPI0037A58940